MLKIIDVPLLLSIALSPEPSSDRIMAPMQVWLSPDESECQLLGPTSRAGHLAFGDPANACGVTKRLRSIAQHTPRAPVVVDSRGTFTFIELWNAVIALAHDIDRRDSSGGPVGILLKGERSYLIAMMACMTLGRLAVLLDASFPDARNFSMIANAGANLVLHEGQPKIGWPTLAYLDPTEAIDAATVDASDGREFDERVDLDRPALVLATSGSSGTPKLIAHSQRTMWHWARTAHDSMQVTADDRALSVSSPASLGGVTALFGIPLAGASIRLCDVKTVGISGLLRCLAQEPITILRGTPSFFRTLVSLAEVRAAFARLRLVHTYGEPLLRADVAALRDVLPSDCFIRTSYGSTECSGLNWYASVNEGHDEFRVAAGVLMPDTEALVEDKGHQCGPGETGELVVRSRYNALGEWQRGRLCPGRLLVDPIDATCRIYHTGDLARYDENGVFVVLGRQDRMVKINGQRVEPAEIETILRSNAGIAEFEIVSLLRDGRTMLIACVVTQPGIGNGLVNALRADFQSALPAFMVPRIVVVDRLPRLPGGKVDATALRAMAGV